MKESVSAALSVFKSKAADFNFDLEHLTTHDIHIHVPAGAVPKDGPSAGIAMFTAITSLLFNIPMKSGIAMTGEITLRGKVLPIGGVKEKTLAAARAGIKTVILPEDNRRDLEDIDPQVRKKLTFHFASDITQVLDVAFGKQRLNAALKKLKSKTK